jgi:hypothetical protein
MAGRLQTIARVLGVLAGASLGVAALAAWRVPGHDVGEGATIALVVRSGGGVDVRGGGPAAATLAATGPHGGLGRQLLVATASGQRVAIDAGASAPDLDAILRVSLRLNGRSLFAGSLWALRRAGLRLPASVATRRELDVRLWIPNRQLTGFERHHETVVLTLEGERQAA